MVRTTTGLDIVICDAQNSDGAALRSTTLVQVETIFLVRIFSVEFCFFSPLDLNKHLIGQSLDCDEVCSVEAAKVGDV